MRVRVRPAATGVLLASLALACTGVRVREFDRESYQPPPLPEAFSRVHAASPEAVRSAFDAVLAERGLHRESTGLVSGALRARLVWAGPAEAAAALDLGRLRRVTTRTRRTYRSYSLFDYDCNDCVVRNGTVVGHETEVLRDEELHLDPGRYRLEGWLNGEISEVQSGTRLQLWLEVEAQPREPVDLSPRSLGLIEGQILDAVAARLSSEPLEVR